MIVLLDWAGHNRRGVWSVPRGAERKHVHVHLDGEKVGGAIVKAKRSNEARSFMPVAHAEAGAF